MQVAWLMETQDFASLQSFSALFHGSGVILQVVEVSFHVFLNKLIECHVKAHLFLH